VFDVDLLGLPLGIELDFFVLTDFVVVSASKMLLWRFVCALLLPQSIGKACRRSTHQSPEY
jgi:hypothetical protein